MAYLMALVTIATLLEYAPDSVWCINSSTLFLLHKYYKYLKNNL